MPDLHDRLEKFLNQSLKSDKKPRLFELYVSFYIMSNAASVQ